MPDGGFTGELTLTLFYGAGASRKAERRLPWEGLRDAVLDAKAPRKEALPWVKLARFGDARTGKGSLRHDANVLAITGIEADYDGEEMPFATAVERLEKAGVKALVYTSPSHTEAAPRWRVLCPTSAELPLGRRDALMGRLNGLFGGIFSTESWTLSQAYYFGRVGENPSHMAELVDGTPIELCDELDAGWIGKPGEKPGNGTPTGERQRGKADSCALLTEIVSGASFHDPCVRLAGVWAFGNVPLTEARARLFAAFDAVPEADRNERWRKRRADVERCLLDIYGKEGKRKDKGERRPKGERAGGAGDVLLTEHGVALAFRRRHGDRMRYCHDTGAWFIWTGTHWRQDRKHAAFSYARALVAEANRCEEFKTQAITGKAAFAGGVERFARADQALAVTADAWNPDPWLLGTPGGTVDLRTGRLRPARPEEMITRATAVAPADHGEPEAWLAFLKEVTARDRALIAFPRKWCGYCLTGDTREHALLFIYGPGGNGKSVFLNTVAGILGDYHATAAMDTFTGDGGGRHLAFLAMLAGARMVTAAETEEGRPWAETKIKEMTGGTPVTANFMRQNPFTFRPQFKVTITGNHKPVLRNVDDAARRRFNIVPFLHKPAQPDRTLEERLRKEWPAILRWMIDGCTEWQQLGLMRPNVVADATAEYFEAQDALGQWLAECCITAPQLAERPGRLLASFNAWAERNGEAPTNRNRFRGWIERQPRLRYKAVKGTDYVSGVGLKPPRVGRVATGGDANP